MPRFQSKLDIHRLKCKFHRYNHISIDTLKTSFRICLNTFMLSMFARCSVCVELSTYRCWAVCFAHRHSTHKFAMKQLDLNRSLCGLLHSVRTANDKVFWLRAFTHSNGAVVYDVIFQSFFSVINVMRSFLL